MIYFAIILLLIEQNVAIPSKEIGLRSYYSGKGNKYPIFKTQSFFDDLCDLGTFWTSIYTNDGGFCEEEAAKYIQCLLAYPNEYWKYPIFCFLS